jgi:hypothetical protein
MEIATGCSTKLNEADAVFEAYSQLTTKIGIPTFLFVLSTSEYNNEILLRELNTLFVSSKIMGGTSCIGLLTENGFCSDKRRALGLFGIKDDSSASYGVAALPISSDPQLTGQEVIRKALENAERPGELPTMILVTSAPGHEEALMNGIMNVVGEQVPIFGGTSADNSISGLWQQFCGDAILQNGIAVAAIYTSQPLGYAFHSGYMPTEHVGTITEVNGRIVSTIDNKPAAEVYNQWTDNLLQDVLGTHANTLGLSTMHPLGREIGKIGNIPYYTLSHPNEIFEDGSMSCFSNFSLNDKVVLMSGTKHSLKTRIKRVIHLAKENFSLSSDKKPKGAFIIYCAGCFLAIQDEIQEVTDAIHSELPSEPYIGMFSFGEQGCLFGGENRHGNLMISAVIFG